MKSVQRAGIVAVLALAAVAAAHLWLNTDWAQRRAGGRSFVVAYIPVT